MADKIIKHHCPICGRFSLYKAPIKEEANISNDTQSIVIVIPPGSDVIWCKEHGPIIHRRIKNAR